MRGFPLFYWLLNMVINPFYLFSKKFLPTAVSRLLIAAVVFPLAVFADTTVTTDPAGFFKPGAYDTSGNYLGLLGNSDTLVSIPVTRTPEYTGAIASGSGNVVTV